MARENKVETTRRAAVNHLAYVLELLGSMFYVIAAVYVLNSFNGSMRITAYILSGASSMWFPFFYSAAFVGTVLLFIVSFTNLMKSRSFTAHRYGMTVSVITGFAWLGLTAGDIYLSLLVIFGFVISVVGSAYGMVDLLDDVR